MDIGGVVAVWLHTLAFVIAWGYYGILGRIVLPGLAASLDPGARSSALVAIERRALPLVVLSLVLFTVTGSYLLMVDPEYAGLGDFFASTWTALMLVKHIVVFGLVGLAVAIDRWIRSLETVTEAKARDATLGRIRLAAEGATGLGAVIALLTAIAQAA